MSNNLEIENNEKTRVVSEYYGENVFNDNIMRQRLPKSIYKSLKKSIDEAKPIDPGIADVVAATMKDWAIEKGATHYTHWFQPMTGITAEKHDSFISPQADGRIIMEFSGKELIKGEPDASSFPSGGLRATFEARGYTSWDCTSPAFYRDGTLYIPTAFYSYTGEVLDKKTPLLRSMDVLSNQAVRIVKLFGGNNVKRVITTVGAEQEYFLISQEMYKRRKDLVYTGRTLFGAIPPKGQEMEDHYFGTIKESVAAFMSELDEELWKLGVSSKTKHNEVAPSQHEMAPIFTSSNIATDHNQLVMDTLKKVAIRHKLICLLHEKPFAGVNGSGKHNNWSMGTDTGENLLEPGDTPNVNLRFLVFLAAVIKAVDVYQDILRASAANPGNDHRLGANEAPPAIISIFLGDQLSDILDQIEKTGIAKSIKESGEIKNLLSTLPSLPKDSTDRNRTSPFAFTGNKFEFRMVPSSSSIAGPNFVLNTAVAEVLREIADKLEKSKDVEADSYNIVRDIVKNHKRIIFNGNNYSDEWVKEAKSRGILNLKSLVEAIPTIIEKKNVELMVKHRILNEVELKSRFEIIMESYIKTVRIEALTMLKMTKRQFIPAGMKYIQVLSDGINSVKNTGLSVDTSVQADLLKKSSDLLVLINKNVVNLEKLVYEDHSTGDILSHGKYYKEKVMAEMSELRKNVDSLEVIVDHDLWPVPTYGQILYNVE
ncbi:MAG: glutamine synthetase III [Spirochaetia bacterium]|nr:glutamine synthetase III [Spirochaetia bacterium]